MERGGGEERSRRRLPSQEELEDLFGLDEPGAGVAGGEELLEGDVRRQPPPAGSRRRRVPGIEASPERRRRMRRETIRRVLVAIPWIAFAIAITVAGGLVFTLAMIALGVVALREYFVMTHDQRPIQLAAYATVPAMIVAAHWGTAFNILLVATASFLLLFLFAARREHRDGITISMGITLLGVVWIGLPLVHAVLLRDLPLHGGALLIDVLVGTFVTDTGAYACGRLFGQHTIAPRLSPNKTIEGLVGGFVIGTMGLWFAGLYQDWLSGTDALIMGAAVAALAPIGDLFESMLKRDLGRKDTGNLFGPHGGLLDRLDAVFFTIVAGYYLSVQLVY